MDYVCLQRFFVSKEIRTESTDFAYFLSSGEFRGKCNPYRTMAVPWLRCLGHEPWQKKE